MNEATPWGALLKTAARLGVAPPEFWRLSLSEWRALTAGASHDALTRGAFEGLARRYPDTKA